MKKGNATTLILSGALVCGVAAAGLTHWYIDSEITRHRGELERELAPEDVVVAVSDLGSGDRLTRQSVAIRPVPGAFVSRDAIRPDQFGSIEGKPLTVPVNRGQPILYPYVRMHDPAQFSDRIEPGKRALTFQVDEVSSQSGMIVPGDKVDLLATVSTGRDSTTFELLRNVNIMATGNAMDKEQSSSLEQRYRTVTLAVSPTDAARITHARAIGKLTLIVRSPGDDNEAKVARITKNSLLGREASVQRFRAAEIILGGK